MKRITIKTPLLQEEIIVDYYISSETEVTEAFYFLDGQNVFNDQEANFKRSLRALKHLQKLNRGILVVAIHSPNNERRFDLYTPYKISKTYFDYPNDIQSCTNFIKELRETIIPTLENGLNIKNRHIIGSSLGALLALYLTLNYSDFNYCLAMSPATFITPEFYSDFRNSSKTAKVYLSAGKYETSDNLEKGIYFQEVIKLQNLASQTKIKLTTKISTCGKHNEASWEKILKKYLKSLD